MKLVRDGIPQIIEDDWRTCKWRRVMGEGEHIAKLAAKMREEVGEFIESPCYEEAAYHAPYTTLCFRAVQG